MAETNEFLTPEQLSERWKGEITPGTLANWRCRRVGPPYIKIRNTVLYRLSAVRAWETANEVNPAVALDAITEAGPEGVR